ncbi:unnamed protein product, partial [marine sediment metagenome]
MSLCDGREGLHKEMDPSNHLVAAALEKRWNDVLIDL